MGKLIHIPGPISTIDWNLIRVLFGSRPIVACCALRPKSERGRARGQKVRGPVNSYLRFIRPIDLEFGQGYSLGQGHRLPVVL